jgi:thymidylate kinase
MEQRGPSFLERVRSGFLAEARRCPETIVVIDAAPGPEQVQAAIRRAARRVLQKEAI